MIVSDNRRLRPNLVEATRLEIGFILTFALKFVEVHPLVSTLY
jgi:hypothetical protein